jgi:hypothetical protein
MATSPDEGMSTMDESGRQIMHGNGQGLLEFCDRIAERGDLNRNTAGGLRAAAKNVLEVESPDLDSIDVRKLDVEGLLGRFVNRRKADYGDGSLETYRSRFRLVVAMYLAWLDDDPNWKTAGRSAKRQAKGVGQAAQSGNRRPRPKVDDKPSGSTSAADETPAMSAVSTSVRLMTYDVPLRPDLIVRVTLPIDLTTDDAERFANFIRVLAFSGRGEPATGGEEGQ